ncbi:hypothetical protein [Actinoplanes sp. NPDC051494]|uniref:hypothetical protein n=1 Tax=Actinoplanes sp. NPDC051494 TaxID=3363907 RepID=UPI0037901063
MDNQQAQAARNQASDDARAISIAADRLQDSPNQEWFRDEIYRIVRATDAQHITSLYGQLYEHAAGALQYVVPALDIIKNEAHAVQSFYHNQVVGIQAGYPPEFQARLAAGNQREQRFNHNLSRRRNELDKPGNIEISAAASQESARYTASSPHLAPFAAAAARAGAIFARANNLSRILTPIAGAARQAQPSTIASFAGTVSSYLGGNRAPVSGQRTQSEMNPPPYQTHGSTNPGNRM